MTWTLYYADGSTFSDEDGEPWESPVAGVVCIGQPGADEDVIGSRDHFVYRADAGKWMECDLAGFWDHTQNFAQLVVAHRIGREMPSRESWRAIYRRAVLEARGK